MKRVLAVALGSCLLATPSVSGETYVSGQFHRFYGQGNFAQFPAIELLSGETVSTEISDGDISYTKSVRPSYYLFDPLGILTAIFGAATLKEEGVIHQGTTLTLSATGTEGAMMAVVKVHDVHVANLQTVGTGDYAAQAPALDVRDMEYPVSFRYLQEGFRLGDDISDGGGKYLSVGGVISALPTEAVPARFRSDAFNQAHSGL